MDSQEWTDAILYHTAHGQATAWAEAQRFDPGGVPSPEPRTPTAELESVIARRLGAVRRDHTGDDPRSHHPGRAGRTAIAMIEQGTMPG